MTNFRMQHNKDLVKIASLNEEERQQIQDTFRKSGLHGHGPLRPKSVTAVLVCTLKEESLNINSSSPQAYRSKSEHGTHAETKIVNFFKRKLERGQLLNNQTIKLFVSFSPCHSCSDELLNFLKDAESRRLDVRLQIGFPALHQINRPSCKAGKHAITHNLFDYSRHQKSIQGLKKLAASTGVHLQTFDKNLWQSLAHTLRVPMVEYGNENPRRIEDGTLSTDWQILTLDAAFPVSVNMFGVGDPRRFQENAPARAVGHQNSYTTNKETIIPIPDDEEHCGRKNWCRCAIL